MVEALFLMQTTFLSESIACLFVISNCFPTHISSFYRGRDSLLPFFKTPFLLSFKKHEKGDEMSCLDTRMTFPAYLAYCGMKKAACCDGHCSALQGQMQHAALADAPYCVCCFSQTHQLFHTNAVAVSCQNDSRFGTIGFGNDNCGTTGKGNWGDTAKGFFCCLYSKRNMAASASECICSHMMEK